MGKEIKRIGVLPKTLTVGGKSYPINSDFRAALIIMEAFSDPSLSPINKKYTMLEILFTPIPTLENPDPMPNIPPNTNEAIEKAVWFLDVGMSNKGKKVDKFVPKTLDYSQDEQLIFSAVNAVFSKDVREEPYLHWWTFYGLCQAIDSESLISNISNIRLKRATGKKLEKHEETFYRENRHLVDIKTSDADYEEMVRQLRR